ncbi:MAG TPA: hypothetical protein VFI13_11365 [Gemmatimonadales bacterium]|nr:hypothetical protein [Gemmatimonadales bacterium]
MPLPWLRIVQGWGLLLLLAIANGAFREMLLAPRCGVVRAHRVSTLLLAGLIFIATWVMMPWLALPDARAAWTVGAAWVGLTLAFEFGAGRYLFRRSWPQLLADYDLAQGRIWIVIPVVTLIAPWLTGRR